MKTTVAIIGGGLAGLYAARLLHAAGMDYRLLEARDRLGGRILSADASGPSADGFDLGPSWFWPDMQPELDALVRELKLAAFPQFTAGDMLFERMAGEAPQRYTQPPNETVSMRIAGGTGALIAALAAALPAASILAGARATRIALVSGGVNIEYTDGDGASHALEAKQVIAALPPRLLEASVAFVPPPSPAITRLWQDTPTWMAPHAKFFALYDRPFWRDDHLSGMAQSLVGPLGEIHDATTFSGRAALFGFVGADAGQRQAAGEALVKKACLAQLVRLFGEKAGHPTALLFKDWAGDAFAATVADRAASGHPVPGADAWVDGPWQQLLSLGGSETADREPGYLAGALHAAKRAVDGVMARLG